MQVLVIVARKYCQVSEIFLKALYRKAYEKYNIIFLSSIDQLKLIISEHTFDNHATPILIFIGSYLYTNNNNTFSTEEIVYKLKKRKKTIVMEYSTIFTEIDIDKLQIPDNGNEFDFIARILEMKNLETLVDKKKISIFKNRLSEIINNSYPKTELIVNNNQ